MIFYHCIECNYDKGDLCGSNYAGTTIDDIQFDMVENESNIKIKLKRDFRFYKDEHNPSTDLPQIQDNSANITLLGAIQDPNASEILQDPFKT